MSLVPEAEQFFLNVYKRIPVHIIKGQGVWLIDEKGDQYLDLLAGIAVNALGYGHPEIIKAIDKQKEKNLHLSNYFIQDVQLELARKLIQLTPFDKVFFANSGTEAIEGLLKLVKKWGNVRNKSKIISFTGSFHGRSMGAVSITGQDKYNKNFKPLLPNVQIVPFNDVAVFNKTISRDTCAVFFEGLSGEGGIREIAPEMLQAIQHGRDKYDYLVICDEIQTGVGRSGRFYNFEYFDFEPDAIATAKGLGGGLPLAAFLVSEKLADVFNVGEHGTTYGGNPLACATGLATVNIVSAHPFLKDVAEKGRYFKDELSKLAKAYPKLIHDVRGKGLMLGVEVNRAADEIVDMAVNKKLIFNIAGGGKVLRFVPPLIIQKEQIDLAIGILDSIFKKLN
jgi:acetylornithine/N-succinyldiaminopimelate aminotransferase